MKVLITGGSGFIGSHLANRYLTNGHDVYIIDDLSTGSRNNIKSLENNSKFKNKFFVTIDSILNRNIMLELIGICDIVVHLAAAVGVKYIIENPLSSIVTNIKGTEIDWSNDLNDRGLKFNNPSAKGSCGCRTSFMHEGTNAGTPSWM